MDPIFGAVIIASVILILYILYKKSTSATVLPPANPGSGGISGAVTGPDPNTTALPATPSAPKSLKMSTWNPVPTSPIGGSGGASFNKAQCPAGSWIVGFNGHAGDYIDQISATCSDGSTLGPFGGNGGAVFAQSNCAQSGVKGMYTRSGAFIDQIQPVCGDGGTPDRPAGGSGGASGTLSCPGGQIAVGFGGSAGEYLDELYLMCNAAPIYQ